MTNSWLGKRNRFSAGWLPATSGLASHRPGAVARKNLSRSRSARREDSAAVSGRERPVLVDKRDDVEAVEIRISR